MKSILIALTMLLIIFIAPPGVNTVSAAGGLAPSAGDFSNWIQNTTPKFAGGTVGSIISTLLPYIYGLAGFLILLYIVWGGYDVLMSQGDPKRMAAGREKIIYAIVGFIVMFAAYWIMILVGKILNIQQIQGIFG